MQESTPSSGSVYTQIRDRIAMFPHEGGTSCDRRVAAAALVTLAALTSFLFFSTAVGIGLSLVSAGLIVWILSDRCSSVDWGRCGEKATDLIFLFGRTNSRASTSSNRVNPRRIPIETSSPPSPSNGSSHSEVLKNRSVSPPPESDKGSRVPTPNAPPALQPAPESQQFRPPVSSSQQPSYQASLSSYMNMQSQGARVGLNPSSTAPSPSISGGSKALENRSVIMPPEMDKGSRVPTPNASPALQPAPGSQQFRPPVSSSQQPSYQASLSSHMNMQSQKARVGLNPSSIAPSPSISGGSKALENRSVIMLPEMSKGSRVPTPNAPPALKPASGSQQFRPPVSSSQPSNPIPLSSHTTMQSQGARVAIGGGVSPALIPFLASKIPSTINK